MFTPKNPCQSCSMPLAKDPHGGGTEADGSISREFCSYCYRDGKFIEPNLTLQDMINKVDEKLREMWIPSFIGKYFTRGIAELSRWKAHN